MKVWKKKENKPAVFTYDSISLSRQEWMQSAVQGIVLLAVIAYYFYRSIAAFFMISPLLCFCFRDKLEEKKKQEKKELRIQFREAILALSCALNAGYSVENAVSQAKKDLRMMYDAQAHLVREFQYMEAQMEMNRTVESLFVEFAERSRLEEAESFAEVFCFAKRSGGDLSEVIRFFAERIGEKLETEEEIASLLSGKRMEHKIMNAVPVFILAYMDLTSPGFFTVLYGSAAGAAIMTGALLFYALAYRIGKKIVEIEV